MYQFVYVSFITFYFLFKFEVRTEVRIEKLGRASGAQGRFSKNLFGPPSIESNAILPELYPFRLAFNFDTFEAVKSSDFEVFSFFRSRIRSLEVDHCHFPVKRKERKVVISCQNFL